jgi:hypothetical protein
MTHIPHFFECENVPEQTGVCNDLWGEIQNERIMKNEHSTSNGG